MTESNVPQTYSIELTMLALEMLEKVRDRRHLELLSDRIEQLKSNPEQQGKALRNVLKGYRSIRAVGQRYRIIYTVKPDRVVVLVIGIGLRREGDRRDVYEIVQRWLDRQDQDDA